MDTLLISLTVVSVVVATLATGVAWRLATQERRRRDARVAALAEAIVSGDCPAPVPVGGENTEVATLPTTIQPVNPANDHLFAVARHDEVDRGRQLKPVLAVAGVAAALILAVVTLGGRGSDVARAAKAPAPLELLTLRHETIEGRLTVRGLVRNPGGSPPVEHLVAVVTFFDGQGGFLSSARAAVDVPTLGAGSESPFVVSVDAAPASVGRYRVSFRRDDRGIVPHVDHRETR
jgi:hypothetical protein